MLIGQKNGYQKTSGKDQTLNAASTMSTDLADMDFFLKKFKMNNEFSRNWTGLTLKERYGTRLNNGLIYYLDSLVRGKKNLSVLDLGCGSGGNRTYLNEIGIKNVTSMDIQGPAANIIGDAHALPFKTNSFDLILSTAVIEHFTDPFLAFKEMARALKQDGYLLATVSFWERWHAHSCFHLTPKGIYVLCRGAGFELISLWSGWGFLESVLSHAISPKFKKVGYVLQLSFDFLLKLLKGNEAVCKHRLKTSGSFGIYARPLRNQIETQNCQPSRINL